jgi:deoxycytidylate deaminase
MAKFTKSDLRYFDMAHKMADKSTYHAFHLGCVIVYQNHVIGSGFNSDKTAPVQKKYNKFRTFHYGPQLVQHKIHAETSAFKSIPYSVDKNTDWSKVKVYIYRVSPGHENNFGLARPCEGCLRMLRDKGVRHVYYTGNSSFIYEELV